MNVRITASHTKKIYTFPMWGGVKGPYEVETFADLIGKVEKDVLGFYSGLLEVPLGWRPIEGESLEDGKLVIHEFIRFFTHLRQLTEHENFSEERGNELLNMVRNIDMMVCYIRWKYWEKGAQEVWDWFQNGLETKKLLLSGDVPKLKRQFQKHFQISSPFNRAKPSEHKLFKKAYLLYKMRQKKRKVYSYKASLEDANLKHKIIPANEFDLNMENINRNYTNWRKRELS